ncbi:MAG: hypothetical protein EP329_20365 [Deltaproteobacteria bacterium]|nr:MAG: hypothetical protein EP329_20365 [Deltaproteobacteria bacterium]
MIGGCTHSAQESFSFESAVSPKGTLTVTSLNGTVVLVRDPSATKVHGTITVRTSGYDSSGAARDAARATAVVETGDAQSLALDVGLPPGARRSYFSVDFDLRVPDGVLVNVATNDGGILIDGLPVGSLDTIDGQVELRNTYGDCVLRTNNAPIVITTHDGPVDARTTNAPIDMVDVASDLIRATTSNQYVALQALPDFAGEIYLATTNAGIDLQIPYEFGAELFATTTAPGNIYVEDLAFLVDYDVPGQLEGVLYDGAGIVDVRTTAADIVLHPAR